MLTIDKLCIYVFLGYLRSENKITWSSLIKACFYPKQQAKVNIWTSQAKKAIHSPSLTGGIDIPKQIDWPTDTLLVTKGQVIGISIIDPQFQWFLGIAN